MSLRRLLLVVAALLAIWIAADFAISGKYSLRQFDGQTVGRLETSMWRAYYDHKPVVLFGGLVDLLRDQYHVPFWRACLGAYHAAHAAVVFQSGHNRADYERALPGLRRFYSIIHRGSDIAFDVERTADLELEWWIIHRERDRHDPADLERALAALQAEIYNCSPEILAKHSEARAEAMRIRDTRVAAGGMTEADWERVGKLLNTSWVSLQTAVSRQQ